jgi:hypothetical protein
MFLVPCGSRAATTRNHRRYGEVYSSVSSKLLVYRCWPTPKPLPPDDAIVTEELSPCISATSPAQATHRRCSTEPLHDHICDKGQTRSYVVGFWGGGPIPTAWSGLTSPALASPLRLHAYTCADFSRVAAAPPSSGAREACLGLHGQIVEGTQGLLQQRHLEALIRLQCGSLDVDCHGHPLTVDLGDCST